MSGAGRLRLTVAYDGGPFQGWQSQARGDTVQDRLETAFSVLCGGRRITVHGSGRTDAGVHARGQVAHADVPGRDRRPPGQWRAALNAHLPPQIRVLAGAARHPGLPCPFFRARKNLSLSHLECPRAEVPFQAGRAWHFPDRLDLEVLRQTAQLLVGTHDFAGFSANRGRPPESTIRTIHRIDARPARPHLLTVGLRRETAFFTRWSGCSRAPSCGARRVELPRSGSAHCWTGRVKRVSPPPPRACT